MTSQWVALQHTLVNSKYVSGHIYGLYHFWFLETPWWVVTSQSVATAPLCHGRHAPGFFLDAPPKQQCLPQPFSSGSLTCTLGLSDPFTKVMKKKRLQLFSIYQALVKIINALFVLKLRVKNIFLHFINEQRKVGLNTLPGDTLPSHTANPTETHTIGMFPLWMKSSRFPCMGKQS